tara:strand:- start:117 stop:488 length:372 start_codon:yes stop_codon:yes gene_type:complete
MTLTRKIRELSLGLALLGATGCYGLVHKDDMCTMKVNSDNVYHLQHQDMDGICKPEFTYVFRVKDGKPTELLSYENDRGCLGRRVHFDKEFDPENAMPKILIELKKRSGPYRVCEKRFEDSLE